MFIVLDTNILIGNYRLEGTAFRAVLGSAAAVGAVLCVPRCVLDEVQAHFEQDLRESASKLGTAARRLGRLLQQKIEAPWAASDWSAEAAKYREWLEKRLGDAGGRVLDYPSFTGDEIVRRAATHRKPFAAEGDRGFKDYLIWKNIVALAKQESAQIMLVTTNTGDFGDDQRGLHSDLLSDLDLAGVSRGRVELKESLVAVLDQQLEELTGMEQQLRSGTFGPFDLKRWLDQNLPEEIQRLAPGNPHIWWVLGHLATEPRLIGITGVAIASVGVRRLPSREILIDVKAHVTAEVAASYMGVPQIAMLHLSPDQMQDSDWTERNFEARTGLTIVVDLLFTYDSEQEEVTSQEIVRAYVPMGPLT